jgi:hypothetical protein
VEVQVETSVKGNVLYELAEVMATNDGLSAAVALRKLAQAGYATLEEVDSVSDWTLLSIPGLGLVRLGAVRRLTRADWKPPSPQAVKAVSRFFSAARVALRYWPMEDVERVIQEPRTLPADARPVEKRLSLQQFAAATRRVLSYCKVEDLVQSLREANASQRGKSDRTPETPPEVVTQDRIQGNGQRKALVPRQRSGRDCEHFAFSADKRREIVEHFWSARARGQVANKDGWARTHYSISGRTLLRYEHEYLEVAGDMLP